MLPKNTTYTFIQAYTFISFQQKVPPIRLFPPILLLIFKEISHLYFYSDSSSIRNSRVDTKNHNLLMFFQKFGEIEESFKRIYLISIFKWQFFFLSCPKPLKYRLKKSVRMIIWSVEHLFIKTRFSCNQNIGETIT